MNLITGIIFGWISMYIFLLVMKKIKEKKGVKEKEYSKLPFTTMIRDSIRHIVFEYSIKTKNNDFLLNIDLYGKTVIQLMHRAHFPELCQLESDINFGIAIYIPVVGWEEKKVEKLQNIIDQESEIMKISKIGKLEYNIIDLGTRVRYGGYLLTRIIKEVFEADENEFSSTLFSEGNLPYWRN